MPEFGTNPAKTLMLHNALAVAQGNRAEEYTALSPTEITGSNGLTRLGVVSLMSNFTQGEYDPFINVQLCLAGTPTEPLGTHSDGHQLLRQALKFVSIQAAMRYQNPNHFTPQIPLKRIADIEEGYIYNAMVLHTSNPFAPLAVLDIWWHSYKQTVSDPYTYNFHFLRQQHYPYLVFSPRMLLNDMLSSPVCYEEYYQGTISSPLDDTSLLS